MCRKALTQVAFLANRNIRFSEALDTGLRRSYTLREDDLYVEVQAFLCPTVPPTYLEIQCIRDVNGGKAYWVWVLMEKSQLPPTCDENLNYYRYQLVIVQSVAISGGTYCNKAHHIGCHCFEGPMAPFE
jgi:hypothetical protein